MRILSIDYGAKRTGIATTDPLQIIASPLTTVATAELRNWLKKYMESEPVERVIIGLPLNLDGSETHATPLVRHFIRLFKKDHPMVPIETVDEQFSSQLARQALIQSGVKKKERQRKELTDQMAATILLQQYLQHR